MEIRVTMSKTKRNNTIELLRFVFAMAVLFFHINKYLFGEPKLNGFHISLFPHGALGVEFFFILSGILMGLSLKKRNKSNATLSSETFDFIKRKVSGIFPYHLLAIVLISIITFISGSYSIKSGIRLIIDQIPSIFFLQMSGIDIHSLNNIEWYLSVMFLAMFMIYPLAKKYHDTFVNIVCPLVAVFILGYMQKEYGSITGVMTWTGLFYKSFLRGFAEICLGLFLFQVSDYLKQISLSPTSKISTTILEAVLYAFCILLTMLSVKKRYEILIVFALAVALPLTFSGITYSYDICKNSIIIPMLGKISMPIYLFQLSAINITKAYLTGLSDFYTVTATVVITMTFAILSMLLINSIRRLLWD